MIKIASLLPSIISTTRLRCFKKAPNDILGIYAFLHLEYGNRLWARLETYLDPWSKQGDKQHIYIESTADNLQIEDCDSGRSYKSQL